jgi:hypothetical protein
MGGALKPLEKPGTIKAISFFEVGHLPARAPRH